KPSSSHSPVHLSSFVFHLSPRYAPTMHYDLAILGAGAAGMLAAVTAAERLPGRSIAIFEKNSRPGIKVLVCGGGRCNFTNAGTTDFLIAQFGRNGRTGR